MRKLNTFSSVGLIGIAAIVLSSCSTYTPTNGRNLSRPESSQRYSSAAQHNTDYASRLPSHINTGGQKTIVVDPNVHAWGAYDQSGQLVRAGLAVAGANWCPDIGRSCHTKPGTFRIASLGSASCKSSIYPLPRGGAPMPYCMFFNKNQGLHGTYEGGLAEANLSHGCVRMHIPDAEWVRYNFANVGTRVIVKPY